MSVPVYTISYDQSWRPICMAYFWETLLTCKFLSLAGSCFHWCPSYFVCSGLTYMYNGSNTFKYVYCMVCYCMYVLIPLACLSCLCCWPCFSHDIYNSLWLQLHSLLIVSGWLVVLSTTHTASLSMWVTTLLSIYPTDDPGIVMPTYDVR